MIVLYRNSIISLILSVAIIFCSLSGTYSSLYATDSHKDSYITGKIVAHVSTNGSEYTDYDEDGNSYWVNNSETSVADLFRDFEGDSVRDCSTSISNDGNTDIVAFMVVGLPTATEEQLSSNIPASQNKRIKVEAYATTYNGEGFAIDNLNNIWDSLNVDVDEDSEESTDVSDRHLIFEANDALISNYNASMWKILNLETDSNTNTDHVYQSVDGYDYYIFAYKEPLKSGEISDSLFDYINNPNLVTINDTTAIKLMPADGNETIMIERGNGAVETYCQTSIAGFNNATTSTAKRQYAPFGVTSITKAFNETYGDYTFNAEDYSEWFVYGFSTGVKLTTVTDYISVSGNGRYEILNARGKAMTTTNRLSTGYTINVYDMNFTNSDTSDDILVESFYVVIFGDVNKDGYINSSDSSTISKEVAGTTSWAVKDSDTYTPYLVRAATISSNDVVDSNIQTWINKITNKTATLNQTTGLAVSTTTTTTTTTTTVTENTTDSQTTTTKTESTSMKEN